MTSWTTDHTHAQDTFCWVESANGHPNFPVQNLPLGLFSQNVSTPRLGVAIGDYILDVASMVQDKLLPDLDWLEDVVFERLNEFLALGTDVRIALRHALFALLTDNNQAEAVTPYLIKQAHADMHLPCEIGDFTSFAPVITGDTIPRDHSGRTSSIEAAGDSISRPKGLIGSNLYGPTQQLDFELRLGLWVSSGTTAGETVSVADAADQIAGLSLINDWTARDIQANSQSAQAKSFATSVSPWIITPEALSPFFCTSQQNPDCARHLADEGMQNLTFAVLADLETRMSRLRNLPANVLFQGETQPLDWTPAQLIAHSASNGCPLQPGDLLASAPLGAQESTASISLHGLTNCGQTKLNLPSGETRTYLEDGDKVRLTAQLVRAGYAGIGFGECCNEITGPMAA